MKNWYTKWYIFYSELHKRKKKYMNLSIVKECVFLELQNSEDIIIFVQLRIQKKYTITILYVCRLYD
jgi:hypothetical protein